jgi:hypothetical protein
MMAGIMLPKDASSVLLLQALNNNNNNNKMVSPARCLTHAAAADTK